MNAVATSSPWVPHLDPLWPRLKEAERQAVSVWWEIKRRMDVATDKTSALVMVCRDFEGQVKSLTRSSVYRITKAFDTKGLEAVIGKAAIRRARGIKGGRGLPPAFVAHWKELCGLHQRRKCLSAWRHLMIDELIAGAIIPGYGKNWRGIWADEHPNCLVPTRCPYTANHEGASACAPKGWSYSSLLAIAPEDDVAAGAAIGVFAMREFNPIIPHTRVGLRPMSVITMDDVKLDVLGWYPGEAKPRRPVGLGVMDVTTGCMIDFTLVPAQEREDGTVSGLAGFWARYAWANILCGIGIDREGIVGLLEHGSAGLSAKEEQRINDILGEGPIKIQQKDGTVRGVWLKVERSSTSGAPLLKGLFAERGRGRPTHKAMLESAWNLLHNELQSLPAPSGKDRDHAPQDMEGWTREDKALIAAGADILADACPEAVEILANARTHALPYNELLNAVRTAIQAMNARRNHNIQNWLECGFVRQTVEFAGAVVPIDQAAIDFAGNDLEARDQFYRIMSPKAKRVNMSPEEAFASFDPVKTLKRFDMFTATRILGPELAQRVRVTTRHQFEAKDHFSGSKMLYSGMVKGLDGATVILDAGESLDVWVNPIKPDWALVSRPSGEFLGRAALMEATQFGHEGAGKNLGILALFRAEQQKRAAVVAGGRVNRENVRREQNARVIMAAANAAKVAADRQFDELASEESPVLAHAADPLESLD